MRPLDRSSSSPSLARPSRSPLRMKAAVLDPAANKHRPGAKSGLNGVNQGTERNREERPVELKEPER